MGFDASLLKRNLGAFWNVDAEFGDDRDAPDVYLREIVSDRLVLLRGAQMLRDELNFTHLSKDTSIAACAADLSIPSVITTLAHTNCGDRINQGRSKRIYENVVGGRFGTLSIRGELKLEAFYPTGGGTDDGATLAHVTVAHQLDDNMRKHLYEGNDQSFLMLGFDIKTHCGRLQTDDGVFAYGQASESFWRAPRAACGAIVGALASFDEKNPVHRRVRRDLGPKNLELLSGAGIRADDGTDIGSYVAAAIIAVQGVLDTAKALEKELESRAVAHLTASITVNQPSVLDSIVYLHRATVFAGETLTQGLGTDASKYSGRVKRTEGRRTISLVYDGIEPDAHPAPTAKLG